MTEKSTVKTHLLLILATFFWGTSPLFMKIALREVPFRAFNTMRLFSALGTAAIMLVANRNSWRRVKKEDWKIFIIAGFFGFFIFQIGYPIGLNLTSVSVAAIIMATLPVSVMLINLFTGTEKPSGKILSGIILSVSGAVIIALGSGSGTSSRGLYGAGVILVLAAEIAYAVYTVQTKHIVGKYTLFQIIFIIVSLSFIPFLIFSAHQIAALPFKEVSLLTWIGIAYSGIFGICIGNMLWYKGIDHLGSTKTSLYANLPPVFGILSGFIFLKEYLTFMQVAGGIIISAGVILVNRKK